MKKFDSPLARVAKWSHQQLSIEQIALAGALRELSTIDQRLQSIREQARESQSRLQVETIVNGYALETLSRFVQKLAEERKQLRRVRADLAQKTEIQRQRVVAQNRKVRLFENLHHRRLQEWKLELSKEEDALTSDLFLAKLARDRQATE